LLILAAFCGAEGPQSPVTECHISPTVPKKD